MFPSAIKKSVMSMQLSHLNAGSMPMEKAHSNGTCITIEDSVPGCTKMLNLFFIATAIKKYLHFRRLQ